MYYLDEVNKCSIEIDFKLVRNVQLPNQNQLQHALIHSSMSKARCWMKSMSKVEMCKSIIISRGKVKT